MAGRGFNPLDPPEIQAFDEAAQNMDDPITELTGRILLHTGLRNGEFNHMRPWWIKDYEGLIRIVVPKREVCIGGAGESGFQNQSGFDLDDRGEPCYKCRSKEHRENDEWTAKTSNSDRTVPIKSEMDDLCDLIRWWKKGYEQVPLSHRAVNNRIGKIADAAGIDRVVVAHDLRHTHGTMLARMDWTAIQIMQRMGHGSVVVPTKYVHYTAQASRDLVEEKYDLDKL